MSARSISRRRGRVAVATREGRVCLTPGLIEAVEDAGGRRRQLVGIRVGVDDGPESVERKLLRARPDELFELRVLDERLHLGRPELLAGVEDEHRLVRAQELCSRMSRGAPSSRRLRRRARARQSWQARRRNGHGGKLDLARHDHSPFSVSGDRRAGRSRAAQEIRARARPRTRPGAFSEPARREWPRPGCARPRL